MPPPLTPTTGRYNAIASLFYWIKTNALPASPLSLLGVTVPYKYSFNRPLKVLDLSAGEVVASFYDLGHSQPKASDINDTMAVSPVDGTTQKGRYAETLIAFECYAHVRDDANLQGDARIVAVRDAILNSLRLAGRKDDSQTYINPAIAIYDFMSNPTATPPNITNNQVTVQWGPSWLAEQPILDKDHPELRVWRSILRISWPEIWSA